MSWEEARDRELAHWSAVQASIGSASPIELLTEINAVDALCAQTREEGGPPAPAPAVSSTTRWAAAGSPPAA
jgi:hypothetical protein